MSQQFDEAIELYDNAMQSDPQAFQEFVRAGDTYSALMNALLETAYLLRVQFVQLYIEARAKVAKPDELGPTALIEVNKDED